MKLLTILILLKYEKATLLAWCLISSFFLSRVTSQKLSILPLPQCKQNFQTPEKTFKKRGKKKNNQIE